MPRKGRKLRWVKFDIDKLLFGTTREELEPDERSVFYDLILLAGQANDNGWIIPPRYALPRILNIPDELSERTLLRCTMYEKVELDGDRIRVINFKVYNPERWETQYYGKNTREPSTNVEDSTIEQKSLRKGPEERRGDKKRGEAEEHNVEDSTIPRDDLPPEFEIALAGYVEALGKLQRKDFRRFEEAWCKWPVLEVHEKALAVTLARAENPGLGYYERCCETVFNRSYAWVEEE